MRSLVQLLVFLKSLFIFVLLQFIKLALTNPIILFSLLLGKKNFYSSKQCLLPITLLLKLTCWMLCTAELVSSPTLPVNSPSFSVYSLKAESSGTWASSSSPDFCFRFWPRFRAFICRFPSDNSPCSKANSGWSNTFPTKTSSHFA